jgi:putative ABC transport system permease protein
MENAPMHDLLLDLRYSLRTLRKAPGFALAAVLTLALGIGGNTAILSVVDGVLLRPAPFENVDRLMMAWETDRASGTTREPASVPDYLDFVDRAKTFGTLAGIMAGQATLVPDQGDPIRLDAVAVTHTYLPMVGVRPLLGRTFSPEDDRSGAPPVTVIGEGLWERFYARDPNVIGRTLHASGTSYTIVGVVPEDAAFGTLQVLHAAAYGRAFADRFGPADIELWVPLQPNPATSPRDTHGLFMLGRLAAGVTPAMAQQEMAGIATDLEATYPSNDARGIFVEPLTNVVFGPVRPALFVLLASVGLVLLVACANVANLLLARSSTRTREVALRTALGANLGRLVRQFLVEGMVLAFAGGAIGVALAGWGTRALVALAPGDIPRLATVSVNGPVLIVTTLVCVVVGVAFGLVPAWQARSLAPQAALRGEATGTASSGAGHQPFRSALVVAELTLAVALVVGAGLLIRSFWRLTLVDPGFRAQGVLKADIALPRSRYPVDFSHWPDFREMHSFNAALLARAATLPGVEAAAIASNQPLDAGFTSSISVVGREAEARDWPEPAIRRITPGYFQTVGLALRRGRPIESSDETSSPPVVLLNEAAARRFFANQEPLGQQVRLWGAARTVVGIVADEHMHGLAAAAPPALYLPFSQAPSVDGNETLLLEVRGDPTRLGPSVRAVVRDIDPALAVVGVEPLESVVGRSLGQQRFTMLVLGAFAGLAIVLALIGVHGVLSFLVARRSRELGLRLALGATPGMVVGQIVRQGLWLTAIGVGLGLMAALAGGRLLRGLLYGVGAADPMTFVVVGAGAVGAAVLASWIPARRAARLDPMHALRSE